MQHPAAYRSGTGATRISEPLPAVWGSLLPLNGSPVRSNRDSASATVPPMSKQRPVLLQYP